MFVVAQIGESGPTRGRGPGFDSRQRTSLCTCSVNVARRSPKPLVRVRVPAGMPNERIAEHGKAVSEGHIHAD